MGTHAKKPPYIQVCWIWMKPGQPGQIERIEGWPVLLGGPRSDNPVAEDSAMKEEVKKWKYW